MINSSLHGHQSRKTSYHARKWPTVMSISLAWEVLDYDMGCVGYRNNEPTLRVSITYKCTSSEVISHSGCLTACCSIVSL